MLPVKSQSDDLNRSGFTEICDNIIESIGEERRGTLSLVDDVDIENRNRRENR